MRKYILIAFLCIYNICVFAQERRIISLGSSITETIYSLGFGKYLVATDVTSISPKAASELPRVSNNRSISAEGLMLFKPTIVLANEGDVSEPIIQQLRQSGVSVFIFKQEYSIKGTLNFIQDIANAIGEEQAGKVVVDRTRLSLDRTMARIKEENKGKEPPKVLFIYARGMGTMSVAGKSSSIDAMITLAGGKNAVQEFADFKPYTTEALVQANPDIILLFDFGASSLGGKEAILKLPGVRITEAGKNKRIVDMNASLLVNFSTRLPEAVLELHKRFVSLMNN